MNSIPRFFRGYFDITPLFNLYMMYDGSEHGHGHTFSHAYNLRNSSNARVQNVLLTRHFNDIDGKEVEFVNVDMFPKVEDFVSECVKRAHTHMICGCRAYFYPNMLANLIKQQLLNDKLVSNMIDL